MTTLPPLVRLTERSGNPLLVNLSEIAFIRRHMTGEGSVLRTHTGYGFDVRETLEEIETLLEEMT